MHDHAWIKLLSTVDCGVVPLQRQDASRHLAVKKEAFIKVIKSPTERYQQLRQVLDPERDEILTNKSNFDLTELTSTHSDS